MHRYLLNFSYIGTRFRGVQKNISKLENIPDLNTIQGVLEAGLKKFNCGVLPFVTISSRTDTGVHALNSTSHVDLHNIYNCHQITMGLNKYFDLNKYAVRILKTRLVPQTFHCRFSAVSRTYLYRLAVLKKEHSLNEYSSRFLKDYINIPIEELNRCAFIYDPNFNVDKFREAASLIEGFHDFRTFMSTSRNKTIPNQTNKKKTTLRVMERINIEKSSTISLPYTDISEMFDFWDVTFKARSFLYRQVRRTMGVLQAVAQDKLSLEDVTVMLQVPSANSWPGLVTVMPPHGLYLRKVEYREEDLMLPLDYVVNAEKRKFRDVNL